MPSHPSAARRRFHTDRIIAKRLAQVRLLWWFGGDREIVRGRLANEQWYLGCHRAGCGVCQFDKHLSQEARRRADRDWRRHEQAAWDAP